MPASTLFTGHFSSQAGHDFVDARLGQDFVKVDLGADAAQDLLSWEDLNEILTTRSLDEPQLRMFRGGEQVPVERYTRTYTHRGRPRHVLQPEDLYSELGDGSSLILDSIDALHRTIASAADDLMRLVGEMVQVNLYLVWGETQGFDTHWDDHDTFIFQLAGEKRWVVHGYGRPWPMRLDTDQDHRPPAGAVWEGVLRPGDLIHVPRGWWHTVRGTGKMSMHLTFGFNRRTGVDWARWVIEKLYDEELFRTDLPRFAPEQERRAHHDELIQSFAKVVAGNRPEAFLVERDRRFPRRPDINLPWAVQFELPPDSAKLASTSLLKPALTVEDEAVCVAVAGKTFRFATVMAPLLRRLTSECVVTVGELRDEAELDDERFAAAIGLLVRHHLAVIRN